MLFCVFQVIGCDVLHRRCERVAKNRNNKGTENQYRTSNYDDDERQNGRMGGLLFDARGQGQRANKQHCRDAGADRGFRKGHIYRVHHDED